MYQHLESLFFLSEPRFSNISHWEWLCHEGLTEMAHVFMPSFGEHDEVGQICRIWPLHEVWSVKKPKTAQMFWPDGLSISPFNEKWESTNGVDREAGRLKENDVLLLAGSWYEIVLILHQIFWQEAKLNEAFLFGNGIMIQRNSFSQVFFFFPFLNNHSFLFCCFFKKSCMVPKVSPLGATDFTVRNTGFCPAAFSVQLFSPGPGFFWCFCSLGTCLPGLRC